MVHEAIESVLINNPDETNQQRLTGLLKQKFYELEDSGEYDLSIIDKKQRQTGIDCLEVAARFISKQSADFRSIEKKVEFKIKEVHKDVIGYIDVVTENGIWDWKTGSIRDDTEQDEIIQGSMYMAGYYNEFGEMPEYAKFVYLKEEKVRTFEPNQENWERMMQQARQLVSAQSTGNFPPDPEESKCYFCGFEMYCSASTVSAGQINEEISKGNTVLWDYV